MDITVYLPDKMGEGAKQIGLNLSGLLRAAVQREFNRAEAYDNLSNQDFESVDAYDQYNEHPVTFQGKDIGGDADNGTTVYLTPKGALAVVGEGKCSNNDLLGVYDSYREFADPAFTSWSYAMLAQVADSLGEETPAEELDI